VGAVAADPEQHGGNRPCPNEYGGRVKAPSAPRAPPCFLDQRLEICDALREVAIVLGIGRARTDGDRQRRDLLRKKLL
jgi:hypothetical protein